MKRPTKILATLALGGTLALIGMSTGDNLAVADPCGMVPPLIIPENQIAIERVGAQKTFVAHYRGVETMVLRPGFKGEIDQFGMLIPFPSPPSLRKVDDDIFNHIAAAVEPPEVIAYVRRPRRRNRPSVMGRSSKAKSESRDDKDSELSYNTVRVVNREAVGMYDVAVLEAGSSVALKRWMDDNGFRYPTGMEKVTQDYVDSGWFFVAVKTQVGQKAGVNPKPGLRKTKTKLPKGSSFTGAVQGMGFRFKTKELVVPMRLSAFNAGKKRNIVYVLTDKPAQIKRIPKRYVVRQVSGRELYKNLTGPLPLRVIGGTYKQLGSWQKQQLKTNRKADRFNGLAKDLIASDMLAIRKGRLANPIEETEKELLAIGESLELRGKQLDTLHRAELSKLRDKAEKRALRAIRNLHLTVIDGEFAREVIADDNLKFARYKMPRHRNNRESYDATLAGPRGKQGGKVYRSSIDELDKQLLSPNADHMAGLGETDRGWMFGGGLGLGALVLLCGFMVRRRRGSATFLALALFASLALSPGDAAADAKAQTHIKKLTDSKKAKAAVDALVKRGEPAVDDLVDFVVDSQDLAARGWAVVALGRIGGEKATSGLRQISNSRNQKLLVRTWAAAALVRNAKTADELIALAPITNQFPSVSRPLGLRLVALLSSKKGNQAETLIAAAAKVPTIATAIMPSILALPTKDLVEVMVTGKDNNMRRMAASYVATVAAKRDDAPRSVVKALRFKKDSDEAPWGTLALFIPQLNYEKDDAKALTDVLLRWHLWADINGETQSQNQIQNNLNSVGLARAAGYRSPGWSNVSTVKWLSAWSNVVGMRAIRKMLKQQNAHKMRRYKSLR